MLEARGRRVVRRRNPGPGAARRAVGRGQTLIRSQGGC
jgi:hypothetical protein